MKFKAFAVGTLFCGAFASSAMAADCLTGPYAKIYSEAYSSRESQLQKKWTSSGSDCSVQVDFETAFGQFFEEGGPAIRVCKNKGLNDGTLKVLSDISSQCQLEGESDGKVDGLAYALEYCSSALFPKVSLTPGEYVINYTENCKETFQHVVDANCPTIRAADWNFDNVLDSQCRI